MEHPFAQYIQMLGKGRKGSRDLTQQEAETALDMILAGKVEPVQLGAFLMLMRVKEETPAEVAGFVKAARASVLLPPDVPGVDLDWASYAGKRRQLPWYVLSALLLASHGNTVVMHGIGGGIPGRVFVPEALRALGIELAVSFEDVTARITRTNFAFIPLGALNPDLERILDLKPLLGLRSPVHTVIRMLNPFRARTSMMGIFHPGYDDTHQQAGVLLGDENLAVFKGEGGEAERNPDAACKVKFVLKGKAHEEEWPALFGSRHMKDEAMDVTRLGKLWRGEIEDEYGLAAVTGTAAIALRAMGRAGSLAEAQALAAKLWQTRDAGYLERARG
ncbi:MAG TPA: glycosyl transferase family protein [Gallionellaceae bacterium]|nr:glycosyl transferase family protein [Gallionellaceae bacterium]